MWPDLGRLGLPHECCTTPQRPGILANIWGEMYVDYLRIFYAEFII
jgi:hypothetical protein